VDLKDSALASVTEMNNSPRSDKGRAKRQNVMHYPGEIEQLFRDGKQVVVGLPLSANSDGSPAAEQTEEIVMCEG